MVRELDTRTFTDRSLDASADRILRAAQAMDRPYLADDDLIVTWLGPRGFFTNVAYVLREPDSWDDVFARVDATIPSHVPASLIAAASVPDMTSKGWEDFGRPPLMIRPAGGDGPACPAELTITEVTDEATLQVWERTLIEEYPDPTMLPYEWGGFCDGRVLGDNSHFLLGTVDGTPVGTSVGHVAAGVNLVEMVATADAARGKGYGAALTWAATIIDPSLPAVLIASDLGRGVYEDLGYHAVSRWTFLHRPAR